MLIKTDCKLISNSLHFENDLKLQHSWMISTKNLAVCASGGQRMMARTIHFNIIVHRLKELVRESGTTEVRSFQ